MLKKAANRTAGQEKVCFLLLTEEGTLQTEDVALLGKEGKRQKEKLQCQKNKGAPPGIIKKNKVSPKMA